MIAYTNNQVALRRNLKFCGGNPPCAPKLKR